jgi:hypothetical protein
MWLVEREDPRQSVPLLVMFVSALGPRGIMPCSRMPVFLLSLTVAVPVWAGAKLTPDEAIKNYEKSLELNPNNGNARVMIRRLKS